jgi:DEAD/DEAH box helicase domain-containing protein
MNQPIQPVQPAAPFNLQVVRGLASTHGFSHSAGALQPGSPARLAAVPEGLHPRVASFLGGAHPQGLYLHQREAISLSLEGQDVCLATPTASGKSLVFMSCAMDLLLRDPQARVLALYPMRALLEDQRHTWERWGRAFGVSVCLLDGGVQASQRARLFTQARVCLATPDVVHSWLLRSLDDASVRAALAQVKLLVLDEAHVYAGAFGSNTACLLARLSLATAPSLRLVAATATIGEPEAFLRRLWGREVALIDERRSGAPSYERQVHLLHPNQQSDLDALLVELVQRRRRFLVFVDARQQVERLCSRLHDALREDDGDEPEATDGGDLSKLLPLGVLPLRAGFEANDRNRIQRALSDGTLCGVICTSALEMGVDIGDLNTIVCVGIPPSVKSLRQRLGRAGRQGPSVALLIDTRHKLAATQEALDALLARNSEPNHLYLDNRYLLYTQALCAAHEAQTLGLPLDLTPQRCGLPQTFWDFVREERSPSGPIADDLFTLRRRASQGSPHHEFGLRTASELSLELHTPREGCIGNLTHAQAMREAFPGAVYLHMARAWRVESTDLRRAKVCLRPGSRHQFATPITHNTCFPDLERGLLHDLRTNALQLWVRPKGGFLAEAEVQVGQRVTGFILRQGRNTLETHTYSAGSSWAQRPLDRIFPTVGLCFAFEGLDEVSAKALAPHLARVGAERLGFQLQDLGSGRFFSRPVERGLEPLWGGCIFDETFGGLRLSGRLLPIFAELVEELLAQTSQDAELLQLRPQLELMARQLPEFAPVELTRAPANPQAPLPESLVKVIMPGSPAVDMGSSPPREVTVEALRFNRSMGLVACFKADTPAGVSPVTEMIPVSRLHPIPMVSQLGFYNLDTDELIPLDSD